MRRKAPRRPGRATTAAPRDARRLRGAEPSWAPAPVAAVVRPLRPVALAEPAGVGGALSDEGWKRLAAAAGARAHSVSGGLYGPSSLTWKLLREQPVLLAIGRGLLLQVAHPAIAAGVAGHSDYEHDPLGRARRTLEALHRITFGDLATALRAAHAVWVAHGRVHGVVPSEAGPPWAGRPYDARDPQLSLWVHATTLETWVRGYETLVHPLTEDERERFWREARGTAGLFGLPDEVLPATWADLVAYVERTVGTLRVGPTARRIGESLFSNRASTVLAGIFGSHAGSLLRLLDLPPAQTSLRELALLLTAGFLPADLRAPYGFAWDAHRERRFERVCGAVRHLAPVLPAAVRYAAPYRAALTRVGH